MAATDQRTDYRLTFAVLCVGVGSFSLFQSMVTPVLATIERGLDTDQATVTWVLTAYLLSASVFTPIVGRVGDKVGKERMLVVALGALAVGSFLAAVAPTIGVLIAARVIQGIGGGVLPLTFGIIRDEFPRDKVAGALGTSAALLAVGGGIGLVVAGPIVDALSYHWLFWLPMILTAAAAVTAHFFVPESPERAPGRINVATALLMSTWLVTLLLAVSQGHSLGLGVDDHGRAVRRHGRGSADLGLGRGPQRHAADRHDDDAHPHGLDGQPGVPAVRDGDVLDVRVPPAVPPDARRRHGLRLRRLGDPVRPDAAAADRGHLRRRPGLRARWPRATAPRRRWSPAPP